MDYCNLQGPETSFCGRVRRVPRSSLLCLLSISTGFTTQKDVDAERARYELDEHHLVCVAAVGSIAPLPEQDRAARLRQLAA